MHNALWNAYNINNLAESSVFNGTGQTIDIIEFDGAIEADMTPFDQCFGLAAPTFLPSVPVQSNGGSVNTTPQTLNGADEADLDMEVAHEIAPGAALQFYLGSNHGIDTNQNDLTYGDVEFYFADMLAVLAQIVQDDNGFQSNPSAPPPIVSASWAFDCEADFAISEHDQYDTTLTQGAAEGIALFQASGDYGSNDCGNGTASIEFSASDPHVVAVGGTKYTAGSNNTRGTEVGWNGSGGGQSAYFPVPLYQQNMPAYWQVPTMRAVPDVSAEAYLDTQYHLIGYAEYCSVQNVAPNSQSCPGWEVSGGTSGATPLWAGLAADLNAYLTYYGKDTLGTASALLYQVNLHDYPNAFYDITSGNNGAYTAGTGYDFVTGMGSPNAWRIATDLNVEIDTNIESDVVWGQKQSSGNVDLMAAYNRSDNSGWSPPTDVTQIITQISSLSFSLRAVGPPTIISYRTPADGNEMDVFALANDTGGEELHGFSYLPASGAWSDLGEVALGNQVLPTQNPVAVVESAPGENATLGLFGISSASASYEHLIEYYAPLLGRASGSTPTFQFRDLTQQTGLTCDHHIDPSVVLYNNTPVVFADCGNKLAEFYDNGTGTFHANTSLPGNSIPNASEAFPGHSLAAMVVPGASGKPATIEAYVASDRNGASALSEYYYDGANWYNYTLPAVAGHTPDQLHAQTVVTTTQGGLTTDSEVIATDPASTSCYSLPDSVQYLYQPQVQSPPPGWYETVLSNADEQGITGLQAIVEQSGKVLTEAYKGAYIGSSTRGGEGGGGCTTNDSIYEDGSVMTAASPQSWYALYLSNTVGDNAGVDPTGTQFPY